MGEAGKLIAGVIGVVAGLVAGFGALALVMQQTGGALFESTALGLLVAAGLVGGGAVLFGYIALWISGAIYSRRKKARREAQRQKRGFKKKK